MRITDAKHLCDRCGHDCGNGAITECTVVSTLDPVNAGQVLNLHFCRDRVVDGKTVKGCTSKLLSAKNVEFYASQQNEEN